MFRGLHGRCALIACRAAACSLRSPAAAQTPDFTLDLDTGGHRAFVKDIAFTADGQYLVSASDDKTIRIWDWQSGVTLRTLRGFIGPGNDGKIFAVAVSPDGKTIAAGGYFGAGPRRQAALWRRAPVRFLDRQGQGGAQGAGIRDLRPRLLAGRHLSRGRRRRTASSMSGNATRPRRPAGSRSASSTPIPGTSSSSPSPTAARSSSPPPPTTASGCGICRPATEIAMRRCRAAARSPGHGAGRLGGRRAVRHRQQ